MKWLATVAYGMPPEGYDTVTLPSSLVQRLNELPGDSHTATIRMLLAEHTSEDNGPTPVTLEASEYARIADEVEGRLR